MAVGLFAPETLHAVKGFELASHAAGIRYAERDDIVLITMDEGSRAAGVFTKNRYCAAPVVLAKEHLAASSPRALLINAGNANAGTGQQGLDDARQSCTELAKLMSIEPTQVLPFSTGVIGEPLPMPKVLSSLPALVSKLASDNCLDAARAIMTTDTVAKAVSETIELDGQTVTLTGIAKGSGMICPNMATMLAYVMTDADIEQSVLETMLALATEASFNRITVDSDTSTNDAFILAASGQSQAKQITDFDSSQATTFYAALERIAIALATSVVRDGEGATKFVKVQVQGAASQYDASAIAYSIAHSPLVKTALYASDPNWGRLLAAIGKADVQALELDKVDLKINQLELILGGEPAAAYTEELGKAEFEKPELEIKVDLNLGEAAHHVWTTDLSHDYVTINADYRS